MVATTDGVDVMSSNMGAIEGLPASIQVAGYSTGSSNIAWSSADWAKYPDALRIDQDFNAGDPTADYLDVEQGAATPAECAAWSKQAWADFNSARRPGQRTPAIYCSGNNITTVVNAMIAGGVTSGVGLVVANWSLSQAQATAMVEASSGPFPIVGVQYSDQGGGGAYDLDVFLTSWLDKRSGNVPPPPPSPPAVTFITDAQTEAIVQALPVITPGMTDNQLPHWYVRRVQAILNDVYGSKLTVDGVYGASSEAAVKSLIQARYGLNQDGIIGVDTWTALVTASA